MRYTSTSSSLTGKLLVGGTLCCALGQPLETEAADRRPNVILFLVDDMGYGDVRALNPNSQIPTPNMDRLVNQGLSFTDAHSNSSLSTPTRYGVLTGRYCFRGRLKSFVTHGYDPMLIEEGRLTIAQMMKNAGYRTAVIGKWHLGMDFRKKDPEKPLLKCDDPFNISDPKCEANVDFSRRVTVGPNERGFDYSYILPAPLDRCPLVYVENGVPLQNGMVFMDPVKVRGQYYYGGMAEKSFKREEALDHFTAQTIAYLKRIEKDKPFFLFAPSTAPHVPHVPAPRFQGKSGAGLYGDQVHHLDYTIGQILEVMDSLDLTKNTLFIFASDNGAAWNTIDKIQYPLHRANYIYNGAKAQIYDGGHRVPLVFCWPGHIKAGAVSSQLVCLTDIMATLAEMFDLPLPDDAAEDSFSLYPILKNPKYDKPIRQSVIHHSGFGMYSIRSGKWKFIDGQGPGSPQKAMESPLCPSGQLYDMENDPCETRNLACLMPDLVKELKAELDRQVAQGYTRPMNAQK